MSRILFKVLISAVLIALSSELSKRFTLLGAILISLPITSLLAIGWLYFDTGDATKVADFSMGIFWAVLPSLLFFALFPYLLRNGFRFGSALGISTLTMILGYYGYAIILKKVGITL